MYRCRCSRANVDCDSRAMMRMLALKRKIVNPNGFTSGARPFLLSSPRAATSSRRSGPPSYVSPTAAHSDCDARRAIDRMRAERYGRIARSTKSVPASAAVGQHRGSTNVVHFVAAEAAAENDDDELAEEQDLATLRCADAAQPHVWQKFTVPLPAAASVNPCTWAGASLRKRFNTGRTALPLLWNLIILLVSEARPAAVCAHFRFFNFCRDLTPPSLEHEPTSRYWVPTNDERVLHALTTTTQPPLKEIIEAQKGKEKEKVN